MKPIHKVTGLLLAGTLTFSTFALTAFAADEIPASSLKVTAASNFRQSDNNYMVDAGRRGRYDQRAGHSHL